MKRFSTLFILAAAAAWGVIGLATRSLSAAGFTSFQIGAVRCVLAALTLIGCLAVFSPASLKIRPRDLWMFFGTGVCSIVFFNVCYFTTITLTTLSAAAILLYTAPIFVMLLSAVFFREKITLRKLIALVLAFCGCILVTGITGGTSLSPLSILAGIGAGFGYALYSIFGRAALARYGSLTVTTYTFAVAGICVLPFSRPGEIVRSVAAEPTLIGYILFLVLLSTVAPYLLYTVGLRYTEPGKASVTASLEPVVASLLGIIVYHEPMSISAAIGAALVLCAVIILNLPAKKLSEKEESSS